MKVSDEHTKVSLDKYDTLLYDWLYNAHLYGNICTHKSLIMLRLYNILSILGIVLFIGLSNQIINIIRMGTIEAIYVFIVLTLIFIKIYAIGVYYKRFERSANEYNDIQKFLGHLIITLKNVNVDSKLETTQRNLNDVRAKFAKVNDLIFSKEDIERFRIQSIKYIQDFKIDNNLYKNEDNF